MIREHLLNRSELLVSDFSREQFKLWEGEVIDFRANGDLSPFAQELFGVHKHIVAPTYLIAKTYHRGSEFKLVFEAKMSNNDIISATYSHISNNIHRDGNLEQLCKLKIVINGKEINDYMGWNAINLSNFGSLRNFYFDNWIPSQNS